MNSTEATSYDGGCTCRQVRYRMTSNSLIAHCRHIFTASRQSWVVLPPGLPVFEEYYEAADIWPADSLARRAALIDTKS